MKPCGQRNRGLLGQVTLDRLLPLLDNPDSDAQGSPADYEQREHCLHLLGAVWTYLYAYVIKKVYVQRQRERERERERPSLSIALVSSGSGKDRLIGGAVLLLLFSDKGPKQHRAQVNRLNKQNGLHKTMWTLDPSKAFCCNCIGAMASCDRHAAGGTALPSCPFQSAWPLNNDVGAGLMASAARRSNAHVERCRQGN